MKHTFGLIRLHSNRVLYEEPQPKPAGSRGAPRKHGKPFKLNSGHRAENRSETFQLGKQTVRVRAWYKLHFKKLATLIGTLVQVEFLKEDGTPRYKRPMWLFWTGPQSVALSDLCRMYLWRFAIEHMFRFLKQHMGLNSNRSPDLVSPAMYVVVCFGILAIAPDARYGPERLSGLVSAQQTTARQADPLSSATLRSGIFVGVGYTGLQAQTRWKRQRQAKELLSATTRSLSCGVQEQKSPGFAFC